MPRKPAIHHGTSHPVHFFGRDRELNLLDQALAGGEPSVAALIGPGGQGKTAIVQHWLERLPPSLDGIFLWSFYRGKDSDLALRELYAYAEGLDRAPELSASYCVDHMLGVLRRECWAIVFDGTEVVQHEEGAWFGRFVHPEIGRLVEELASAPLPGVVVLTSRFPMPALASRRHARVLALSALDAASGQALLASLGVHGGAEELDHAARSCGLHAKAVELLGTYLVRFHAGRASAYRALTDAVSGAGEEMGEEAHVARIVAAWQKAMPQEMQDILALAVAFRHPPTEDRLVEYLASAPVQNLLVHHWGRLYDTFSQRPFGWLAHQVDELVQSRLLERVGRSVGGAVEMLIDAHPLVRRGFEHTAGSEDFRHGAGARTGFLRGRPDRRPPATLEEAREEVELFYAYADAGMWNEADSAIMALDNPKHRFLAPAFERDLLLRFFPRGDWRKPPLWTGFGRYRSLAICFELLGQFEEALETYRVGDAPLRGDSLLALGRLEPLLEQSHVPAPWQTLWQAYRAHALCLAARLDEARAVAATLVPVDVYEWVHLFECLLRLGRLDDIDLNSVLYHAPLVGEHLWSALSRRRMRADYFRVTGKQNALNLDNEYATLVEAYDRGGLPYERVLTRLGQARWLFAGGRHDAGRAMATAALELARRQRMAILAADACALLGESALENEYRRQTGYNGAARP
jgi:hypothetical protein